MENKKDKQWLVFEKICASVRKKISPKNYRVEHSIMRLGIDSGYKRQLDIVIYNGDNNDMFTFLDAKCYSRKIDVKDVESILGLARDVRALKCGIVTTIGYTKAAYNVARIHNMDLVVLADTDNHEWKKFLSIPFCSSVHKYIFSSLAIKGTVPLKNMQKEDPFTAPIRLLNQDEVITLGGYVVNEFEFKDPFSFSHPECDEKDFKLDIPLDKKIMGNGYLIVTGVFKKTITHHQKYIIFDEFHGFVDLQKKSGLGVGVLSFSLDEVVSWEIVEKPPETINFCHPHFLGHNLPYHVDDISNINT